MFFKTISMLTLKVAILQLFGWLMLTSGTTTLPEATYSSVDSIVASEEHEHLPLSFDAVIDVSQAFTSETPTQKIVPQSHHFVESVAVPVDNLLSYYAIGQQIVINLTIKTIIFPFHCFT